MPDRVKVNVFELLSHITLLLMMIQPWLCSLPLSFFISFFLSNSLNECFFFCCCPLASYCICHICPPTPTPTPHHCYKLHFDLRNFKWSATIAGPPYEINCRHDRWLQATLRSLSSAYPVMREKRTHAIGCLLFTRTPRLALAISPLILRNKRGGAGFPHLQEKKKRKEAWLFSLSSGVARRVASAFGCGGGGDEKEIWRCGGCDSFKESEHVNQKIVWGFNGCVLVDLTKARPPSSRVLRDPPARLVGWCLQ